MRKTIIKIGTVLILLSLIGVIELSQKDINLIFVSLCSMYLIFDGED